MHSQRRLLALYIHFWKRVNCTLVKMKKKRKRNSRMNSLWINIGCNSELQVSKARRLSLWPIMTGKLWRRVYLGSKLLPARRVWVQMPLQGPWFFPFSPFCHSPDQAQCFFYNNIQSQTLFLIVYKFFRDNSEWVCPLGYDGILEQK